MQAKVFLRKARIHFLPTAYSLKHNNAIEIDFLFKSSLTINFYDSKSELINSSATLF